VTAGGKSGPERRIRLLLSYDGTRYCGWETQKNGLAIQEVLEKAIRKITGEEVELEGSGRTDAGVHALGQVATFTLRHRMRPGKLVLGLNATIPPDIAVLDAADVPAGFHARFSAVSKTYRYTILNDRVRRPLMLNQVYHFPQPLDAAAMHAAAQALVGTHDFRAFAKEADRKRSCVRTIFRASVERDGPLIRIEVTGSGFLYNMIRIIAGTLIDVGLGRRPGDALAKLVAGGKRAHAGFTVPACGLCLVSVDYPPAASEPESPGGPAVS
jgi:tRNA pseudouridine38-40 synthase